MPKHQGKARFLEIIFFCSNLGEKHAGFQAWNRNISLIQRKSENPALCSAVLCDFFNFIFHKQSQSQAFLPSVCINTIHFIENRFKLVRNWQVVLKGYRVK